MPSQQELSTNKSEYTKQNKEWNGMESARNEKARDPLENRIKMETGKPTLIQVFKKNKYGKLESSQYTRREDSENSRKIQAHWTRLNWL